MYWFYWLAVHWGVAGRVSVYEPLCGLVSAQTGLWTGPTVAPARASLNQHDVFHGLVKVVKRNSPHSPPGTLWWRDRHSPVTF